MEYQGIRIVHLHTLTAYQASNSWYQQGSMLCQGGSGGHLGRWVAYRGGLIAFTRGTATLRVVLTLLPTSLKLTATSTKLVITSSTAIITALMPWICRKVYNKWAGLSLNITGRLWVCLGTTKGVPVYISFATGQLFYTRPFCMLTCMAAARSGLKK